jgi:hypothetical protein
MTRPLAGAAQAEADRSRLAPTLHLLEPKTCGVDSLRHGCADRLRIRIGSNLEQTDMPIPTSSLSTASRLTFCELLRICAPHRVTPPSTASENGHIPAAPQWSQSASSHPAPPVEPLNTTPTPPSHDTHHSWYRIGKPLRGTGSLALPRYPLNVHWTESGECFSPLLGPA